MDEKLIEAIREEAKKRLPPHGTHGFEHTERVFEICKHIGGLVGADPSVLLPAALLHDLGRGEEDHAAVSAMEAKEILAGIGLPEEKVWAVVGAISTHSFSFGGEPASLEAMVLSDADKLDAMGALGVYRAAMYSAEHLRALGDFVDHFYEKLLKLRDMLHTDEARRLAEKRHRFMLEFLEELRGEKELEG